MKLDERNIFLLDGIGAILSAISTGAVLPLFYQWTGVPSSVSSSLALLGLAFAAYSLSCFWFVKRIRPLMLLAIILANSLYCIFSIGIILAFNEITFWGRAYFLVEFLIVAGVVVLEATVYRRIFGKPIDA